MRREEGDPVRPEGSPEAKTPRKERCPECGRVLGFATGVGPYCRNKRCPRVDDLQPRREAPAEGFPTRFLLPSLFLALSVILSCWWIPTLDNTAGALREYSELRKKGCEADTGGPVTRPAGRKR